MNSVEFVGDDVILVLLHWLLQVSYGQLLHSQQKNLCWVKKWEPCILWN